jgi:hypothetical protein
MFPSIPTISPSPVGFAPFVQDVEPRSTVPVVVDAKLQVQSASTSVTVEADAGDLVESGSTFHTDVDKNIIDKVPLDSQSSQLSAVVTQSTPGIASDSNGQLHGLGDHAENSISMDGQPETDQISKVFSNQLPLDAIQSMEVIEGAPPAEYGDKTSVVIDVTTRSGLGVTTPHGSVTASYGSFGTSNAGFDLAYGTNKAGNFISASAMNSGRFLDPPEFVVCTTRAIRKVFSTASTSSLQAPILCTSICNTHARGSRRRIRLIRRPPHLGPAFMECFPRSKTTPESEIEQAFGRYLVFSGELQYQVGKRGPWLGFNWRYDSGLVAGATPCFGLNTPYNDCPGSFASSAGVPTVSMIAANYGGVPLDADQEFEAGLFCGSQRATPTSPLPSTCPASQFGSTLLRVPAPGTENDDRNPPRVAGRDLFDLALGEDNVAHFSNDHYRTSAQLTVINLANK